MTTNEYLTLDPALCIYVSNHLGRVIYRTASNKMWELNRAYFMLVDNPGECEQEMKTRARGPTGFWRLNGDEKHS